MEVNVHFKLVQKKPLHHCKGLILLAFSTFFTLVSFVYFILWPIFVFSSFYPEYFKTRKLFSLIVVIFLFKIMLVY